MMASDNKETENEKNFSGRNDAEAYHKIYGYGQNSSASFEKGMLDEFGKTDKDKRLKTIIPIIVALIALVVVSLYFGKKTPISLSRTTTTTVQIREEATNVSLLSESLPLTAHLFFDANGGIAEFTEKTGCIGDKYNHLPDAKREGYLLEGWFSEKKGGEAITSDTTIQKATEMAYAHWIEVQTTTPTTIGTTAATQPQSNPGEKSTARSGVKRSDEVLFRNEEMVIYSPDGFYRIDDGVLPKEEAVRYRAASTGIIGNDAYYSNLGCDEYIGDGGHTAAWFADADAADISAKSYTRTVNGLTFSCVDYHNEYGWYGTKLYYVSDGRLIEISGSSGARDSIWPMLEACVFGL